MKNAFETACDLWIAEDQGRDVRLGLIDSIELKNISFEGEPYFDYNRSRNFSGEGGERFHTHGALMLDVLGEFAPPCEINLYRAVRSDGTSRSSDAMRAITAAKEDGIDVLSLSAGEPHEDCEGRCAYCSIAQDAINNGTTLIAAAGNRPKVDRLLCPAKNGETICVGGFVSLCTADVSNTLFLRPSTLTRPPGAYWESGNGEDADHAYVEKPLCGQKSCSPLDSCVDNRIDEWWDGNVPKEGEKPDVLAPCHYPWSPREDSEARMYWGTIISTPIVVAVVASIIGSLSSMGKHPESSTIRRTLREASIPVDRGGGARLSAENLAERFAHRYGLEFET